MALEKMVYLFGGGRTDGGSDMRDLLGGKGANLAEMARLGLPVSAGFTITTEVCTAYYQNKRKIPPALNKDVEAALKHVEKSMGAVFGDPRNPLLVSCRSGARVSMPGMMDTVLNIGLNDQTVQGLIAKTDNPRFAYDSYRRFVAMYGDVVMGIRAENELAENPFDALIEEVKARKGYGQDTELTAEDLKELVRDFKALIRDKLGRSFPEDPREQLWEAIGAVFSSWTTPRAVAYRQMYLIPETWGTAVNVQAMVFGNMGRTSATGVAFSRDPSTGENYFYGEYLVNAQGEDVVAGLRTPNPINRAKPLPAGINTTLAEEMPKAYRELDDIRLKLEKHYRDMQDIEFTVQEGKLWMLQCRNGKRTAQAAVKIAADLVREKMINEATAITRVEPDQLIQLLLPHFDPKAQREVIARGLPASPGAAVGRVVFTASEAETWAAEGRKVILVRLETNPADINGMINAQGILTARGGMTSHAAVVARGMGKTCVAGVSEISISYARREFTTRSGHTVREGDWISLDGSRGEVISGQLPTIAARLTGDFSTIMKWAGDLKRLGVRTNADTPHDARVARELGAEGIGLCRTEHMFFGPDRITAMREMILAADKAGRLRALEKLLPMQRDDFIGIFQAMDGLPVTIRTLDPPLHEFLPQNAAEISELAQALGEDRDRLLKTVTDMKEHNPMLGHRGCRLGIVYPEITAMQARAIFEAAAQAVSEKIKVLPEIMIPLVGHEREFTLQKTIVDRVAKEVMAETGIRLKYLVGTMIELPRAVLVADKIAAAGAEFFSFGTNDLTQTTYGLSRDDSGKFLPDYLKERIWEKDPFATIDKEGVGDLIRLGIEKGLSVNPSLKIGICGEHGGDPETVKFCNEVGMNYVSCSPFRVPLARLAAGQAAVAERQAATSPKPAAKKTTPKPAAKKTVTKPAAKPAAKKTAVKPAAKPAAKKTVTKPAAKPAARKTAVKPAAKPAARKTAVKPAAKPAAKKPAVKPVARKTAVKPAAKPAARKTAVKPAAKKPAAK